MLAALWTFRGLGGAFDLIRIVWLRVVVTVFVRTVAVVLVAPRLLLSSLCDMPNWIVSDWVAKAIWLKAGLDLVTSVPLEC